LQGRISRGIHGSDVQKEADPEVEAEAPGSGHFLVEAEAKAYRNIARFMGVCEVGRNLKAAFFNVLLYRHQVAHYFLVTRAEASDVRCDIT
jgi:hypothetical protein